MSNLINGKNKPLTLTGMSTNFDSNTRENSSVNSSVNQNNNSNNNSVNNNSNNFKKPGRTYSLNKMSNSSKSKFFYQQTLQQQQQQQQDEEAKQNYKEGLYYSTQGIDGLKKFQPQQQYKNGSPKRFSTPSQDRLKITSGFLLDLQSLKRDSIFSQQSSYRNRIRSQYSERPRSLIKLSTLKKQTEEYQYISASKPKIQLLTNQQQQQKVQSDQKDYYRQKKKINIVKKSSLNSNSSKNTSIEERHEIQSQQSISNTINSEDNLDKPKVLTISNAMDRKIQSQKMLSSSKSYGSLRQKSQFFLQNQQSKNQQQIDEYSASSQNLTNNNNNSNVNSNSKNNNNTENQQQQQQQISSQILIKPSDSNEKIEQNQENSDNLLLHTRKRTEGKKFTFRKDDDNFENQQPTSTENKNNNNQNSASNTNNNNMQLDLMNQSQQKVFQLENTNTTSNTSQIIHSPNFPNPNPYPMQLQSQIRSISQNGVFFNRKTSDASQQQQQIQIQVQEQNQQQQQQQQSIAQFGKPPIGNMVFLELEEQDRQSSQQISDSTSSKKIKEEQESQNSNERKIQQPLSTNSSVKTKKILKRNQTVKNVETQNNMLNSNAQNMSRSTKTNYNQMMLSSQFSYKMMQSSGTSLMDASNFNKQQRLKQQQQPQQQQQQPQQQLQQQKLQQQLQQYQLNKQQQQQQQQLQWSNNNGQYDQLTVQKSQYPQGSSMSMSLTSKRGSVTTFSHMVDEINMSGKQMNCSEFSMKSQFSQKDNNDNIFQSQTDDRPSPINRPVQSTTNLDRVQKLQPINEEGKNVFRSSHTIQLQNVDTPRSKSRSAYFTPDSVVNYTQGELHIPQDETSSDVSSYSDKSCMVNVSQMAASRTTVKNKLSKSRIDDGFSCLNNQYTVYKLIGQGAQGKVKLGYDKINQRYVAIKVVVRHNLRKAFFKPENKDQLQKEVSFLIKMQHPHVVQLLEVIDDPDKEKIYMIFEFLEQGAIQSKYYFTYQNKLQERKRMNDSRMSILMNESVNLYQNNFEKYEKYENDQQNTNSTITQEKALKYYRQLGLALDYLHNCMRIIHRDIKPDNLLVNKQDQMKIGDFGVSMLVANNINQKKQIGSKAFFAPECFQKDGKITFSVDIWAAGVTLYKLVFGDLPFKGKNNLQNEILTKEVEFPNEKQYNPFMIQFIKKCLVKNYKDRMTAAEWLEDDWITQNQKFTFKNKLIEEEETGHLFKGQTEIEDTTTGALTNLLQSQNEMPQLFRSNTGALGNLMQSQPDQPLLRSSMSPHRSPRKDIQEKNFERIRLDSKQDIYK